MEFTAAQSGCTWNIPTGVGAVNVLIVGGGGGAGFGGLGGGGGAGEVLYSNSSINVMPGDTVTLSVGKGGTGGYFGSTSGYWYNGLNGDTSAVTIGGNQYIATGGGGGGGNGGSGAIATGAAGGSGGGGTSNNSGGGTSRNSYSGFTDLGYASTLYSGNGGGGAGAGGANSNSTGGNGISMWGLSFAGGGGGWLSGAGATAYGAGTAGAGVNSGDHGTAGTDGTGSGGGGGSAGGSGLVVFRYVTDLVAPTFVSASVPASGTTLVVTFSESISATTAPAAQWSVTTSGTLDSVTSVSVSGTQVTLNLQTQVTSALTVLVSYTDPGAGDNLYAVQDLSYNDASTFTNQAVTNNATTKTPITISISLSGDGVNAVYRSVSTISVTLNGPGKVRFMVKGKAIPGCQAITASAISNYYQAACTWKPSILNTQSLSALFTSSNSNFSPTSAIANILANVAARSGKR